jgi:hypothetical protein
MSKRCRFSDVASGSGALNIKCKGKYAAKLVVRDAAGTNVVIRSWEFEVLPRDTSIPAYGPVRVFRLTVTLGHAIEFHAVVDPLEALPCV